MKSGKGTEGLTLVVGASPNPWRYSHLAVLRLRENGYPVVALGKNSGRIGDTEISEELPAGLHPDTVSIYLNPDNQKPYYDQILALHPGRLIFNPGAENPEFSALASGKGIATLNACTLVMLATGQY